MVAAVASGPTSNACSGGKDVSSEATTTAMLVSVSASVSLSMSASMSSATVRKEGGRPASPDCDTACKNRIRVVLRGPRNESETESESENAGNGAVSAAIDDGATAMPSSAPARKNLEAALTNSCSKGGSGDSLSLSSSLSSSSSSSFLSPPIKPAHTEREEEENHGLAASESLSESGSGPSSPLAPAARRGERAPGVLPRPIEASPTPRRPARSILRKRTKEGEAPFPAPSPRPCTGRRVGGLWSPSVSVVRGDGREARAEAPRAMEQAPPPPVPLPPAGSPLDRLRGETLSRVLCYLPLADLLRAGRLSRRWRHEVHHRGNENENENEHETDHPAGGYGPLPLVNPSPAPRGTAHRHNRCRSGGGRHRLWEKVDATSFLQETYERFLGIGKKRMLLQQQEQQQELRQSPPASLLPTSLPPQSRKKKPKRKSIVDPSEWARIQTGLALGKVLGTRTTKVPSPGSDHTGETPSVSIRSLVLGNIGNKLSADRLDDFLPTVVLSNLRELTLTNFEGLTDTHVHVLLLSTTTMLLGAGAANCKPGRRNLPLGSPNQNQRQPHSTGRQGNQWTRLVLDGCHGLTSHALTSIAKLCSQDHLRELSLRDCPGIDTIAPLSELLVTKLGAKKATTATTMATTAATTATNTNTNTHSHRDELLRPSPVPLSALVPAEALGRKLRDFSDGECSTRAARVPAPMARLFETPPAASVETTHRRGRGSPPLSSSTLASLFDLPGTSPTRRKTAESLVLLPPPPPVLALGESGAITSAGSSPLRLRPPPRLPSDPLSHRRSSPGLETQPLLLSCADGVTPKPSPPRKHQLVPEKETAAAAAPSMAHASRRYHRHKQSLSKEAALPFPPGLLPSKNRDEWERVCRLHSFAPTFECRDHRSDNRANGNPGPSTALNDVRPPSFFGEGTTTVGSLEALDLRGTAVRPREIVGVLWSLTHHRPRKKPLMSVGARTCFPNQSDSNTASAWCRVWFEELHLNGGLDYYSCRRRNEIRVNLRTGAGEDATHATIDAAGACFLPATRWWDGAMAESDSCPGGTGWTGEDRRDLEASLAMDEMELRIGGEKAKKKKITRNCYQLRMQRNAIQ